MLVVFYNKLSWFVFDLRYVCTRKTYLKRDTSTGSVFNKVQVVYSTIHCCGLCLI